MPHDAGGKLMPKSRKKSATANAHTSSASANWGKLLIEDNIHTPQNCLMCTVLRFKFTQLDGRKAEGRQLADPIEL